MSNRDALHQVWSSHKRAELLAILTHPNPAHFQRVYLAAFLKFVGYSEKDVVEIVKNNNEWLDFSEAVTSYQVHSIFASKRIRTSPAAPQRSTSSRAASSVFNTECACEFKFCNLDCKSCSTCDCVEALRYFKNIPGW